MKRTRCCENLALRLQKRELAGAPPGAVVRRLSPRCRYRCRRRRVVATNQPASAPIVPYTAATLQAPHSRRFFENIVPDTQVPGPVPPPNTVLACFTPCGRFLLGFQPVANEVVAYRFKGLHASAGTHVPGAEQQTQPSAGRDGQQQQQQPPVANGSASEQPQAQQPHQPPPGAVAFGDIFEEHWRCSPCPNRQEQLSPDLCLGGCRLPRRHCHACAQPHLTACRGSPRNTPSTSFLPLCALLAVAHGSFLLVCSASPEWQPLAGAAASSAGMVPRVERTTLHVVRSGDQLRRLVNLHSNVHMYRQCLGSRCACPLTLPPQATHSLQPNSLRVREWGAGGQPPLIAL